MFRVHMIVAVFMNLRTVKVKMLVFFIDEQQRAANHQERRKDEEN